jgi:lipopolysaccharide/colanic/teichoic acid biosynthesis glycosyltransferase
MIAKASIVEEVTTPLPQDLSDGPCGYFAYSAWAFVNITLFNAVFSLLFLLLSLPLFLAIGLAVKLRDGGPVFYKGTRLGLSKRPFGMYKFRTLPVGAQRLIGSDLYDPATMRLDRFSRFLRDTRLDELPQLLNILKGDMDFIGPRPVRPEVYEHCCRQLKGYDQRFMVRPGLIGYAQLFTPHSAPKRMRSLIDRRFLHRRRRLLWDLVIIGYTVLTVLRSVVVRGSRNIWEASRSRIFRLYSESRSLERVRLADATVEIFPEERQDRPLHEAALVDINERHFKISTDADLGADPYWFRMEREVHKNGRTRSKRSWCLGSVYKELPANGSGRRGYVVAYEPATPLNRYILDQYFFRKSMA